MSQNENETVTVKLPSGEMVDLIVPAGASNEEIRRNLLRVAPEEFSSTKLSRQDVQDLVEVRSKLPQDDPRADKIDRLLFRQNPEAWSVGQLPGAPDFAGTFGGAMQAFTAAGNQAKQQLMESRGSVASAPQLTGGLSKRGQNNPLERTNYNMMAALSGQKQATPEDQEQFESGKQAGFISGTAQAALGGVGGALTGPTVTTGEAGTGIFGPSGEELTRAVTRYGPSLGKQALQSTVSWVSRHPLLAAAAYEGARRAGLPVPNVIGWLAKAAGETRAAK